MRAAGVPPPHPPSHPLTRFPAVLQGASLVLAHPSPHPTPHPRAGVHVHVSPHPSPGCPSTAGVSRGLSRTLCGVGHFGDTAANLPGYLWHLLLAHAVMLVLFAAVATVTAVAAWAGYGWWWRRAIRGGYWVQVIPARTQSVARAADVWRLLGGLVRRAAQGRHPAVPLTVELFGGAGGVRVGVWLPGWVPLPLARAELARVWPGSALTVRPVPMPPTSGEVAGFRLAATVTDHGWLIDDPHPPRTDSRDPGADPLAALLSVLREDGGMVQILVRPVPPKRKTGLRTAAIRPTPPRRPLLGRIVDGAAKAPGAVIRELLGVFEKSPARTTGRSRVVEPPDALQRDAMREAADKYRHGPHLLVSIRIATVAASGGDAVTRALLAADTYVTVSHRLAPRRLRLARRRWSWRRAARWQWLLVTAVEAGALFHLPADPAAHGFVTTARHRAHPVGTPHAVPEEAGPGRSGWSRDGWTAAGPDTAGAPSPDRVGPYTADDTDEDGDGMEEPW